MSLLSPRWILGHILALVAVVAFANLGLWQLRRHEEKSDLRDRVAEAQARPRIPVEEATDGEFRAVLAFGEYDFPETLVLRSQDGRSGYMVLTPLRLPDGSAVLVNRGWVPLEPDFRLGGDFPPGIVKVAGTMWPAEEGTSIPDGIVTESGFPKVVRRIDPEIQAAFVDYPFREDYLVLAESSPPPGGVRPAPPPEIPLGSHLGYALQWAAFTAIVLIGYPILLRRNRRRSPALTRHDAESHGEYPDDLNRARGLAEEPPGE